MAQPPITQHLRDLARCQRCPAMHKPVVLGRPVMSKVLLVGQAPGDKEPQLGRPFAWTAGRTLFKWFHQATGWTEDEIRDRVYFAAVCRCFPGKNPKGGDRVPSPEEIKTCNDWLQAEIKILQPSLILPVGKLAINQFLPAAKLSDVIGKIHHVTLESRTIDCLPLPHPSGASTWHRTEPGQSLLQKSLQLLAHHPALRHQA